MKIDVTKAYNELPALPPEQDIETKKILKVCIEARASLAELRKSAEMLPNQSVLINSLPLLEAQASSEIENIVTTTDKLFQYANSSSEANIDSATKEALRYRTALREGFESIKYRPLNTVLAEKLCSTLHGIEMTVRKASGTALYNQTTGEIIYTPPEGEMLLRKKLHNWEVFLHDKNDIDPLIKMAIGHYQFEAIHPFTDGNGRTGRILNILYLIEQELLTIPILYLSRYIIRHKKEYYQYLLNVTLNSDWESWIIFMLNAVANTSQWTCNKITSIVGLMEETIDYVKTKQPKIYSRELVELLFTQPYCRISNVVDAGIVKRQTAAEYLQKLVSEGVLKEIEAGREKIYINTRLMQILFSETDSDIKFVATGEKQ
ncbi:Filamentation induced by cAMP protein Fic [Legionella geestiana]|uniref:Protein adenylyltransferase n=1 Tax=Legionella geestiana TaxID=45065 RepID=A0A0W0U1K8_9GAMM|nr:Fic family protein [Legionella geestiana]KTD01564.1 Filamentation induced by cAMP protein Fic [Legionella geestiana]QBS12212.1 Fic family protein [Legionella geestiana]QDQ40076.1 Fic family protein [Legionella geestiana]STX53057.1 Filamentation induced by cAMP protein Fic [Legionella geestiana]